MKSESSKAILIIAASPRGSESLSRKLANALTTRLLEIYHGATIESEDLTVNPPPHLNIEQIKGFFTSEEVRSPEQKRCLEYSDRQIQKLIDAEILVFSFPVWNFMIPSSLKAWIDQIVRVGMTFKYTETGPKGLLSQKKAYLCLARGGVYPELFEEENPNYFDFSILYMKTILRFVGIKDISVFKIEGVAIPEMKNKAFDNAISDLPPIYRREESCSGEVDLIV